jgi:hypothetical protein
LEKLGPPILPALRKAATANNELEVKRRIELVVTRIENTLLKIEEKHWQALDAPRRGIKDRLLKILARTPTLSDHQVASVIYLLAVGRPPSDDEVKRAQKHLGETHSRLLSLRQLTRSLVEGKDFCAKVASANLHLLKLQQDVRAAREEVPVIPRLNSIEIEKIIAEVAKSVVKTVKTDEPLVDLAYLLVISRFPRAEEVQMAAAHLKRAQDRAGLVSDIIWALVNTKEFVMAR